jgi:O-antigen/teichoic acid export membrane protein
VTDQDLGAPGAPAAADPVAGVRLRGAGRSFLWTLASQAAGLVGNFFILGYNVRVLGTREFGALGLILAASSLFGVVAIALNMTAVRAGATASSRLDHEALSSLRAAHALYLGLAVLTVAASVGLAAILPHVISAGGPLATRIQVTTVLVGLGAAVGFAGAIPTSLVAADERFDVLARLALLGLLIRVVGTIALTSHLRLMAAGVVTLTTALLQLAIIVPLARRRHPEFGLRPRRTTRAALRRVIRYTAGLALLNTTSTIISSSDAFVIGGLLGPAAIARYRVGASTPLAAAGVLFGGYGVIFPALAKSADERSQVEAVAFLTRVVSWCAGAIYAGIAMLAPELVQCILGHTDLLAEQVLVCFSCGLAIDTCFHGIVLQMFVRGNQQAFVKWSPVELVLNLALTVALIVSFGPVGAALAAVVTYVAMDIALFPLVMRGHWPQPAGRFAWRHGLLPCIAAGAVTCAMALVVRALSTGLWTRLSVIAVVIIATMVAGLAVLTPASRARVFELAQKRG